ncbi:ABC transporter permease subunit [Aquitalea magnusonii]|uniref:ABC transporter permease subunit n=1 Tax=Aquitalea magnusonii TaxID=332411 RepID=UPI0009EA4DB3|nr:ABC transporter permease subunit [Aquitalea magnusonii]
MSEISEVGDIAFSHPHPLPRQANEPAAAETSGSNRYAGLRIIPARYPARIAGSVLAVLLLAAIVSSVATNPRWGWPVFAEWFLAAPVLEGLGRTLLLTAIGTVLGSALGTVLALARVSRSPLLASLSWSYIWLFRSIPLIVLLLILNNLGYLYETINIGVPYTGINWFSYSTTELISPFAAAVLGLSLNQAAFSAEIIRGGILSVEQGQLEAAAALGLPRGRQIFRIVLPQAMRTILPTAFNDIIGLAKGTANVYILALPELFYTIQVVYHRNLEVIPLLMVATVWYLIILTVLSTVQVQVERHYARGALRQQPQSLWQRARQRWWPATSSRSASSNQPASLIELPAVKGGAVAIHSVSKRYGHQQVLDAVSLTVPPGSVTVIIGPSGSGKSTLLRSINHLERVDSGFIAIDGELIGYRQQGNSLHELKEKDILQRRVEVGMAARPEISSAWPGVATSRKPSPSTPCSRAAAK